MVVKCAKHIAAKPRVEEEQKKASWANIYLYQHIPEIEPKERCSIN